MEQQQQQQNYQQQQQKQKIEQKKVEFRQNDPATKVCSTCGYKNELNAKFCEECGNNLVGKPMCPVCKAEVYLGADICEVCGAWLLEGKCKFCYAEITENEKYCSECGNPTDGIVCPNCGTNNIFDFCKKCNTPLTEAAHKELEKVKANPFFQNIFKLNQELQNLSKDEINEIEIKNQINEAERKIAEEQKKIDEAEKKEKQIEKMLRLEQFLNKSSQTEQKATRLEQKPQKSFISEEHIKQLERVKQNLAGYEHRKVNKENKQRDIQAQLNQMAQLTFSTGQEARRFFDASRPSSSYVWECNFVHYVHPKPSDCARPELGGKWVICEGSIDWQQGYF
ncbi:MAG: zinc ribbon domain-containing protein [bacterium]